MWNYHHDIIFRLKKRKINNHIKYKNINCSVLYMHSENEILMYVVEKRCKYIEMDWEVKKEKEKMY